VTSCNLTKTKQEDLCGLSKFRSPVFFSFQHEILQAGGQCMPDSHCPTKTLSEHGDMEKRRLFHVPAKFKLLTSCCNTVFLSNFSMTSRRTFVELPSNLDPLPTHFRRFRSIFRSNFKSISTIFGSEFRTFRSISSRVSHDLYFDELPFGLCRTMLIFCLC